MTLFKMCVHLTGRHHNSYRKRRNWK